MAVGALKMKQGITECHSFATGMRLVPLGPDLMNTHPEPCAAD